ncbi:M20/M25/M40 family metallo-hydrolase [Microbacterium sp. zg-Y818]|uniref:M20 family metallopeptidase n=1 Tax=unclassified Microbacterium TaxID=2609290 RepID=UPI00214CD534|nr:MULTISPECIES: M20/M25/M40 family metallo-hydrolase [unclassified Microbacterium]MCR2800223.1 M20/M25/M40 family metallo-hydrolase [Microbacterium sp. zg.Y818]WIM22190.1 M20/M25/M40 family metallo-hydrolase [Microbacterium sp. zg-Y818]
MDVLDLTRELVAIDSQNPGPQESEIVNYVARWAKERGFDAQILEPVTGRPNLVVAVDRGGFGHLGLSGHLDTKPIGDAASEWKTSPLELTVAGDEAFGLGSTDMKGGVAAMMLALEDFASDRGGAAAAGRLSLVLTADEEQGSDAGAKALAADGLLPDLDAIVIGEPSGIIDPWEAVYLVSRGICCFHIDVLARQGHSGLSHTLGRNATLHAADLLHAFETFRPTVDTPGEVGCAPTVNPGMFISGGVSFGTWPGQCRVSMEVRLVPGMSQQTLHSEVDALVRATLPADVDYRISYLGSGQGWMPAVELSPKTVVARAAQLATKSVLGRSVPFAAFPGGTDATYFMGQGGIPTIASLGPGWISVAHGANEKVGVSQLYQAHRLYGTLVETYFDLRRKELA